MRRTALLAALLGLVLAGTAQARLPALGHTIHAGCPYPGMTEGGCAYPDGTVYVPATNIFWHEQGHAYDFLRLTWPQRARFRGLVHSHGRTWFDPWGNPEKRPNELFAEAYSSCAAPDRSAWFLDQDALQPTYHGMDGYAVTQRQYRAICKWLARIVRPAGAARWRGY